MKFVIFCEKLNDGTVKTYTPEELAIFLQQFREKDGEAVVKIRPYIPEEALVLNSKTGETRIVRAVDYCFGTVTLYNSDKPDTVYRQKYGYLPIKLEEWDIDECIVLSHEKMHELGFQFESESGRHKDLHRLEWEEFFDSCFG